MTQGKTTLSHRFAAWLRRNMPTREQMEDSRWLRPFAHIVLRSDLWRFTRRSVPRGVALGMLVGIIIPFAQIFFAALASFTVRANVPVAAVTTFVTNPFTTPFIWAISYKVGAFLLRLDAMVAGGPIDHLWQVTDFWSALQWLTNEGKVLALGLIVVAIIAAAVSHIVTGLAWTGIVRARRRRILAEREGRA